MQVLGIIAEYNPFHNGHAFQLETCKRIANADYVIVVMSGNFTQRGECAALNKFTRTKMALLGGADLVIELPVHAACASAGYFADGGIALLCHTGVVTHLGFGSESGDLDFLLQASDILYNEPEIFKTALSDAQRSGMTYATARQKALFSVCPTAGTLLTPNNILSLEYINALRKRNSPIQPVTVKRQKTGYHDLSMDSPICSATALRHAAKSDSDTTDYKNYMPDGAANLFADSLKCCRAITNNDFSDMLYYALTGGCTYKNIFDIDEALSNRILKHKLQFTDFDSFCMLLKSRNYTYTRICRAMYHLLLNITKESGQRFFALDSAPYLRLLGFKKSAAPLLHALKGNSDIPVITKAADASAILDSDAAAIFNENLFADNMYRYIESRLLGKTVPHEFSRGLIIL